MLSKRVYDISVLCRVFNAVAFCVGATFSIFRATIVYFGPNLAIRKEIKNTELVYQNLRYMTFTGQQSYGICARSDCI